MARIPDDARNRFDQAAANLNNGGRGVVGVGEQMIANATAMAAMANVSVAEGVAMSVLEAEERLTTAMNAFAAAMLESARQQQAIVTKTIAAEERLVRWTVAQGWLTAALTFFTAVQVVVAVLEYLKP